MKLFDKIICPIDFSQASVRALQWTQELARQFHSHVIVLYVMQSYSARVEAAAEKFPAEITESMREFLAPLDIDYEILLSSGEPWQKITALSQGLDATLVVMSTRGLTGPRHKIVGSTTEQVLRSSSVPVLTLSPDCTPPPVPIKGRVLFPVCRLKEAPPNYVCLRNLLREIAASTCLFHVVENRQEALAFHAAAARGPVAVGQLDRTITEKELLRIGSLLTREPVAMSIRAGSPAEEILNETESGAHDYVLLNVKKAGPLSRFIESTVYKVIAHSRLPVFSVCCDR